MYESVGYNVCLLVLSAAEHSPRARSFDLEVTPWAPTRFASCIFHPGPTEAYEPLRSTLCPARTPFRDLAAPGSTRKPVLHTRGISRAKSFDLEVTPWAPTRLTSCIFHPGPTEAYEPLRSTLCPARTPFRDLAAPESARMPPVQVWHFPGQKLRLGGDALGADPTYLLYLASRSRGGLRRIDFGAWPRAATSNHICLMQVGGSRLSPHLSRAAGHLSGRVGAH